MTRPMHILFADDNRGDRDLASEALEGSEYGMQLHLVSDGEEAMDFLRRRGAHADAPRPQLILLDLNMPRKSGLEALKEIKADAELKTIPVTVFTSSTAPGDIADAYAAGANAYVIKPPDLDGYLDAMRRIERFWCRIARVLY